MSAPNTVCCPGCEKTLRVGARVISDGNEYWFYLCSECEDVALRPTPDGDWTLSGERRADVPALVTAGPGTTLLWNLDVSMWEAIACRLAGRNMTVAEWEQFGPQDEPYRATCADY